MSKILIEKTIYARDKFGVKRQVFLAGDRVEPYVYQAILRNNTVVNPEDLPIQESKTSGPTSLHSRPIETKVLEPEKVEREVPEEVIEEVVELEDEVVEELPQKRSKKRKSKKDEVEDE